MRRFFVGGDFVFALLLPEGSGVAANSDALLLVDVAGFGEDTAEVEKASMQSLIKSVLLSMLPSLISSTLGTLVDVGSLSSGMLVDK